MLPALCEKRLEKGPMVLTTWGVLLMLIRENSVEWQGTEAWMKWEWWGTASVDNLKKFHATEHSWRSLSGVQRAYFKEWEMLEYVCEMIGKFHYRERDWAVGERENITGEAMFLTRLWDQVDGRALEGESKGRYRPKWMCDGEMRERQWWFPLHTGRWGNPLIIRWDGVGKQWV